MERSVPFASDDEISNLARRFIDRSLPRDEWTHEAHVAVAVWLLSSEACDAFAEMPALIRAYNEAVGTPNTETEGYHETITLASLKMIHAMLRVGSPSEPLHGAVSRLLDAGLAEPSWLLAHWSRESLFSPAARAQWVAPDLAPLPSGA